MKNILIIINIFLTGFLFSQNITNTLGTGGVFTIKDGTTTYLTLYQSNGLVGIAKNLTLTETPGSQTGILYKGADRFLHTYHPSGTDGYNTFLGLQSGNFDMSGTGIQSSYNTGVGNQSLSNLTTGSSNSAFGYLSLRANTTGNNNSAFGLASLLTNTTGFSNSAFGTSSLYSNISGTYNSAFGTGSLYSNNTGLGNSSLGFNSLFSNTTGIYNSAFGISSLQNNSTGNNNSGFGSYSLLVNTTGNSNSAFGYQSLADNTTGNSNSAYGSFSLINNTTGSENTAIGYGSMPANTTGNFNTSLGTQSLYINLTGNRNTAVGFRSLYSNLSGANNVSVGYYSAYFTTGNHNTALGYSSLSTNTTGSNNTAVGYGAEVPSGTSSNQVRIGNENITYAGVQVAWTITSDRRWKENILTLSPGLKFISKLNPVSYTRKNDENGKTEFGLIAQEVEDVLKQEGIENSGMLTVTEEGMYELRYNDLIAPMIKAIQELKAENDNLKTEVIELKELKDKILVLEKLINDIKSNSAETKEIKIGEN